MYKQDKLFRSALEIYPLFFLLGDCLLAQISMCDDYADSWPVKEMMGSSCAEQQGN